MANTYNIGASTANIKLAVDITSIGLAASRASVLVVNGSDPGVAVAHSVDATGDIPEQAIGYSDSLKGKRLTVYTKVSLTGDDANNRALEAAHVKGEYEVSGGSDGNKSFNNPVATYVDPDVFLLFVVDLV